MIASTIVFGRVLVEVAIVAPQILVDIVPPLTVMMSIMALLSLALYLLGRSEQADITLDEDPSELKAAIIFGLLYAGILFAVAAAKENFGNQGLYVVAALSGLTDMDAITLSTAQLINKDRLEARTGWQMILIGFLSNLVFKGGVVALLANRSLAIRISLLFSVAVVCGVLLLIFWP
jgi:uncharacterized membrane protein (DUF4010 family)